jgi:peptide/nickel transport system substrate-binding protein
VPRLKTNAKLVTSLDGFEALASIEILAFNFDNPQLKDVRRAAGHRLCHRQAGDRGEGRLRHRQGGHRAHFVVDSWAYEPNVNKYPYNPQRAAKLLDDAGFPVKPDGSRMTLRLIADGGVELNRKACEIVKEQLQQVASRSTCSWSSAT